MMRRIHHCESCCYPTHPIYSFLWVYSPVSSFAVISFVAPSSFDNSITLLNSSRIVATSSRNPIYSLPYPLMLEAGRRASQAGGPMGSDIKKQRTNPSPLVRMPGVREQRQKLSSRAQLVQRPSLRKPQQLLLVEEKNE